MALGLGKQCMDLDDLRVFFESEPVIHPSDVPWQYSGASFHFRTDADSVWCRLATGEGELAVVWRQGDIKRLELSLEGYFDMKLETQSGVERFVAIPSRDRNPPFVLQLRPHVFAALGAV